MSIKIARVFAEKFISWTKLKISLHGEEGVTKELFFRERDIWWVHLGKNVGHEQDGKNDSFERPVIVLRKFGRHLFWGVPTSTKVKPDHKFYKSFGFKGEKYSAILSQMKPVSSRRLIRKIGRLPNDEFDGIKNGITDLL